MENNYDIITRINKAYSGMSKRHKQIASYILEHYDQAAFMTAAKMGEALSISESTVVRFAAAIGYEGYPEMQAFSLKIKSGEAVRNHRVKQS